MGSVKDLVVLKAPTPTEMGVGRFDFSDRYSVFDWGEMPDHVPYKGASLCAMSAYFFERLADKGVKTHYIGLENDGQTSLYEAAQPSSQMLVKLVMPQKPAENEGSYDYAFYREARSARQGNFVVPMEFIYRNTLPKGSSVFRRLKDGSLTLKSTGLAEMPKEGDMLPSVFMDVSTKYEASDRYPDERIGEDRATFLIDLSCLTPSEAERACYMLREANDVITRGVSRAGLQNDDGKIELAFTPERELMVVDALGTLDECRFTYGLDGQRVDVSKEIPRQWYRRRHQDWVTEVESAKKQYGHEWKSSVRQQPEPLPQSLLEILSNIYTSTANAVVGINIFDAPELPDVVKEYQRFVELEMRQ